MKTKALLFALLLLCSGSLFARVICTNTAQVGTFEGTTTFLSGPPALSFLDPGLDPATNECTEDNCVTLPCLQAGCIDLPYNTRNCLAYLVSQCGTAAPVIRQVSFLSPGACP